MVYFEINCGVHENLVSNGLQCKRLQGSRFEHQSGRQRTIVQKTLRNRLRSNSAQMSFLDTNFLCKTFPDSRVWACQQTLRDLKRLPVPHQNPLLCSALGTGTFNSKLHRAVTLDYIQRRMNFRLKIN